MRLLQKALTFDDVLLVPAYSNVLPRETVLSTQFTRDLRLNIPFCSAAMDTVTEANLAIALAQEGGIGIIHKNMTAQAQAAEVNKVKRHEAGMVADPITIGPDMIVADVIRLTREHNISGLPVVQGEKVLGMVTHRDLRFEDRMDAKISEIMTPAERLITIKEGATLDDAKKLMHEHRLERVLVVDDNFHLRGLMTVKDIIKATEHPYASKDKHGKLLAGAAVGVGAGTEERVELLVDAGVDVLVVDTAHGHSQGVLDRVKWVKQHYPQVQVIGGNIATATAALALVENGADAVKVGIGPGSVCTTRKMTGVGYPQLSAIIECADAAHGLGGLICSDGGCTRPGDIAKAFGGGADFVMLGGMLAGHNESGGEVIEKDGKVYRSFYGMSSKSAMNKYSGGVAKYRAAEGKTVYLEDRGPVADTVQEILGGVRSACTYVGARRLKELTKRTTFVRVTQQLNEVFGKS